MTPIPTSWDTNPLCVQPLGMAAPAGSMDLRRGHVCVLEGAHLPAIDGVPAQGAGIPSLLQDLNTRRRVWWLESNVRIGACQATIRVRNQFKPNIARLAPEGGVGHAYFNSPPPE